MSYPSLSRILTVLTAATVLPIAVQSTVFAYDSPVHVFSVNDVMGGFDGSTFGSLDSAQTDSGIICDLGPIPCPDDNPPYIDKAGVMLYPVDSEFGWHVVDFLGAEGKMRDGDFLEGFVGNISESGVHVGIKISNAPTLKYKVKPPLGTWCQGLGGAMVKCETEHYTVMEHVTSCYETIPYFIADPVWGTQGTLSLPSGRSLDCATTPLDDAAYILVNGTPGDRLINPTPCDAVGDPVGCQMFPNDKTDALNNLALSTSYSVQLKDDGKALYGWGGVHKRPNDIRMYARLVLPDEWKVPGADYPVTSAQLVVNHWITNNPNDQLRPEDLENEAATGRKPSYRIEGTPGTDTEVWKSLEPCYEGDGDVIDNEEGNVDPTFIAKGTYLKNMPFALDPAAMPGTDPSEPPYAFSSDLYGAFTNAFYTTLNRDPFEWSYDSNPDPLVQDFVGSPVPDDTLGTLVSGPRWRLKPGKFGQDLPSLEIPLIECSKPPFNHDNIKYVVGTPTTTVINLLDWGTATSSPLSSSKGWVDVMANEFVTIVDEINGRPITSNGIPMSDDFDLAVYVKGDSKSTAVYNAQLIIEYDGEVPVPDDEFDLGVGFLYGVPGIAYTGETVNLVVDVTNYGPDIANGMVTLTGVPTTGGAPIEFFASIVDLAAGAMFSPTWQWTVPAVRTNINWTAEVAPAGDLDPDLSNNTATRRTKVR